MLWWIIFEFIVIKELGLCLWLWFYLCVQPGLREAEGVTLNSYYRTFSQLDYKFWSLTELGAYLGALKCSRQNLCSKLCLKRIDRVYASQLLIFPALCGKNTIQVRLLCSFVLRDGTGKERGIVVVNAHYSAVVKIYRALYQLWYWIAVKTVVTFTRKCMLYRACTCYT